MHALKVTQPSGYSGMFVLIFKTWCHALLVNRVGALLLEKTPEAPLSARIQPSWSKCLLAPYFSWIWPLCGGGIVRLLRKACQSKAPEQLLNGFSIEILHCLKTSSFLGIFHSCNYWRYCIKACLVLSCLVAYFQRTISNDFYLSDAVFGGIILAQFDEFVLVMQWHYSSYSNVTACNQVKSKVALIMKWATHRCDSYKCFVMTVSTWCGE